VLATTGGRRSDADVLILLLRYNNANVSGMPRLIRPLPTLLLALVLLLGQWLAVVHAAEHPSASLDHGADCALCLGALKSGDSLPPAAVALPGRGVTAGDRTPVAARSTPSTVSPEPAIRGPPAGAA